LNNSWQLETFRGLYSKFWVEGGDWVGCRNRVGVGGDRASGRDKASGKDSVVRDRAGVGVGVGVGCRNWVGRRDSGVGDRAGVEVGCRNWVGGKNWADGRDWVGGWNKAGGNELLAKGIYSSIGFSSDKKASLAIDTTGNLPVCTFLNSNGINLIARIAES